MHNMRTPTMVLIPTLNNLYQVSFDWASLCIPKLHPQGTEQRARWAKQKSRPKPVWVDIDDTSPSKSNTYPKPFTTREEFRRPDPHRGPSQSQSSQADPKGRPKPKPKPKRAVTPPQLKFSTKPMTLEEKIEGYCKSIQYTSKCRRLKMILNTFTNTAKPFKWESAFDDVANYKQLFRRFMLVCSSNTLRA